MSKPHLVVVGRGEIKRYELANGLQRLWPEVEVVYDRRVGERRAQPARLLVPAERRRRERRSLDISPDLSVKGWAHVRRPGGNGALWLPAASGVIDRPGYSYYRGSTSAQSLSRKRQAAELSHHILNADLQNPDFLVLRERRRIFARWVENLPKTGLHVLDVGGRLQPYRPLLESRLESYLAVDPAFEGLLNVVATGEALPFPRESFDLVICTQVLNYAVNPFQVIDEIHRVLRPGGSLFLSVPAIFPRYADQRWRFMPEGLLGLLAPFSFYEIVPEGYSIAGMLRLFNLFLDTIVLDAVIPWARLRDAIASVAFTVTNLAGLALDRASCGNSRFTTNYSCLALK
jgi:hypothetical protein